MKEALWYEKLENKTVRCQLCPHGCAIKPGDRGICRVRENRGGKLFATNYGKAGGFAVDPMEKKPLYNFYPGSYVVSAGARGCNFSCEFCQNWQLARGESRETDISPHSMIHVAERHQKTHDVVGLAYTYSEPFMWYEFVLDTSRLAEEAGLKNIMVTNGFVREKPLRRLLPHIDAMNIDVKGFTEEFYREIIHGSLKPVLRTAEMAKESGCHVEITTLLIPGLNDSHGELKQLVDWVSDSLGKGTPLHFSRYFPNHRMDTPATPVETLYEARDIAMERLDCVYLGNVGDRDSSSTYCTECGHRVIDRTGYGVSLSGLDGNKCTQCGKIVNVVI